MVDIKEIKKKVWSLKNIDDYVGLGDLLRTELERLENISLLGLGDIEIEELDNAIYYLRKESGKLETEIFLYNSKRFISNLIEQTHKCPSCGSLDIECQVSSWVDIKDLHFNECSGNIDWLKLPVTLFNSLKLDGNYRCKKCNKEVKCGGIL